MAGATTGATTGACCCCAATCAATTAAADDVTVAVFLLPLPAPANKLVKILADGNCAATAPIRDADDDFPSALAFWGIFIFGSTSVEAAPAPAPVCRRLADDDVYREPSLTLEACFRRLPPDGVGRNVALLSTPSEPVVTAVAVPTAAALAIK